MRQRRVGPIVVLVLLLSACRDTSAASTADAGAAGDAGNNRLDVVVTMSVIADFVAAVGGEHVEVTSLVDVGGDPHIYEPRPSDSRRITDADLVVENGLGLSPWFEPLRVNAERVVDLTAALAAEVRDDGEKPDPHLWMDPQLVAEGYVAAIEAALVDVDPDHAEDYARNATAYRAELADLDRELRAEFEALPPERRKLITSHDAYGYFARAYGLEVIGTVIGVSTEDEPSARRIQELIDVIRDEGVPTIFLETTINPAVIERVAADAGATIGDPLYGDSVGVPGSGADTYESMMRSNAAAIVGGLLRERGDDR